MTRSTPARSGSEAERNSVKDWFDKTIQSRLDRQGQGHILVVMQRLHEDDLSAGHLLQKESGWKLILFPIRDAGPEHHIRLDAVGPTNGTRGKT